jgi:UDP-N-acetylmuramoylalanine-D-glutamate ligase
LPGRLELLGSLENAAVINDTSSTTPTAAIKALESFPSKKIIHIVGGNSKNLPIDTLIKIMKKQVKAIVYLEGSGTKELQKELSESSIPSKGPYSSLEQALTAACYFAQADDTILFSPAFTSFAFFNNEFHRGEAFNKAYDQAKNSV